jgi:signal transduction histidine kinase
VIRDIPTRWLLLLSFLGAGLLPVMIVALVSYGTGRAELKQQAFRQLESVRNIKRAQLARFFDERRRDVVVLSRDPYMLDAFTELEGAFRAEGGASGKHFAGEDRRAFQAPDSYRAVHDRHFPFLSHYVDQLGYYDLLLLEASSGEVCFSVEKERDFAAVVADQPTALRDVWREVAGGKRAVLSDTRPYPPSANAAAQFVAAPVERNGRVVGVLALQIAITEVDSIVRERSGMGLTGDTWLVGSDFRPRSDSGRDPRRTVQAAFAEPSAHLFRNEASLRALAGDTGSSVIVDQEGRRILAAWTPFEGVEPRWALVAQIDESEIDAQIDRALNTKVLVLLVSSGVAVVALALLLSMLISRSVGSMGTQLGRLSDAVMRGELLARADEQEVSIDFRGVVRRINDLVDAFVARLDALPVAVLLVDRALQVRFANTAARKLQRDQGPATGRPCCEAFGIAGSCAQDCLVKQAIERSAVVRAEVPGRDDTTRYLITASPLLGPDGRVVGGFEVIVDQTEARRAELQKQALEDRITRMQRLEALGTLAGGIAHDFNNILTYMFAYADIVQRELPAHSPAAPHVDQLLAAIERAAALVGQILSFSRQLQADPQPLDLGPLVKEAVKLVNAGLPEDTLLQVDVPNRPFTVMANPSQMHQVILNLVTNARHAVAGRDGSVVVALSDEVIDASDPRIGPSLAAGSYRVLRVTDTGCGMDARTLGRIFEPFFTTKPVGQGTGMGLALVHGIVTSCGGAILVESALGKGSTFRVFLPSCEDSVDKAGDRVVETSGAGRRILFVDDERHVCETSKIQLESLGYIVTTFMNGADAIAELRAHASEYDAVVTDLRMPDVGGLQVAEAARKLRPALPVVLATAYTDGVTPEQASAAGVRELLFKPFRRSDLARVLGALVG